MVSEADHCPPVVFRMGDAGSSGLVVDRAVAGFAPGAARSPAVTFKPSTPPAAPRPTPAR